MANHDLSVLVNAVDFVYFGLTLNLSNINELNSLRIKKGKAGASKERVDGATAHVDQPKETTEKTELTRADTTWKDTLHYNF
jgi:hypothetical protein